MRLTAKQIGKISGIIEDALSAFPETAKEASSKPPARWEIEMRKRFAEDAELAAIPDIERIEIVDWLIDYFVNEGLTSGSGSVYYLRNQ